MSIDYGVKTNFQKAALGTIKKPIVPMAPNFQTFLHNELLIFSHYTYINRK